ncbi:MAG TPA: zf-HC2 domain-containing protein, partial [Anaerolineaceae bacterium]
MNGQTHVIDDLPAYTLGSLDGEEKARVEAHLGHCPICWAELQAYEAVVEQLPVATPLVEPPVGLRAEILHRAAGPTLAQGQPRAA